MYSFLSWLILRGLRTGGRVPEVVVRGVSLRPLLSLRKSSQCTLVSAFCGDRGYLAASTPLQHQATTAPTETPGIGENVSEVRLQRFRDALDGAFRIRGIEVDRGRNDLVPQRKSGYGRFESTSRSQQMAG